MSEYDAAQAAVQAALDAGATYADARVMHRRSESMTARNGEVDSVSQDSDSGLGVRALVAKPITRRKLLEALATKPAP